MPRFNMRREDKLGYGFMVGSIAVPLLIVVFFESKILAAGFGGGLLAIACLFLYFGHTHTEVEAVRRAPMATILLFTLCGVLIGGATSLFSGIAWVLTKKSNSPESQAQSVDNASKPLPTSAPSAQANPVQPASSRPISASKSNTETLVRPLTAPNSFLQLGPIIPVLGKNNLVAGSRIALRVVFENKSQDLAIDVHNWGNLAIVNMSNPNAEMEIREQFDRSQRAVHERSRNLVGDTIGVGQQFYNDAESPTLSADDVEQIKNGTKRLYLQVWASWKDRLDRQGTMPECWWISSPITSPMTIENVFLHNCDPVKRQP